MSKIIVLDAGHGGKDAGAVKGKLYEKDIVLKVVKLIKQYLEKTYTGATIKLTRSSDVFLSLSERARRANDLKASVFVSVHVNAGGGTGFESYKYPSSSSKFQNAVHGRIKKVLEKRRFTDRGKKSANLAVVRETRMPALLTELGFIDRDSDRKLLEDDAFLQEMAEAHGDGIADYLNLKKKSTVKKKYIEYKIKKGDTLWSIANDPKHKTTVDAIYQANTGLKKKDVIYAGEKIKIPVK